ncbi:uncharacterized protein HMF8227_02831 [Saliniradius amylolyticus]|uniref:DUF2065 domain-containing protein n=1 Tax=Saliniradius amylolyticus TaxID=2183582 RepID=A0A2S2E7V3_9ALTE|nr:DUF2065 domain-containing protein [Saliniradius amylolyticus]AWL13280.1 uncharacterized protein HMF8227_02831 [Saliniradius amylolyticus]
MLDAFWLGIGFFLIIEGLGPMLFPNKWQGYVRKLAEQPANQLQAMGGIMVVLGVVILWFMH